MRKDKYPVMTAAKSANNVVALANELILMSKPKISAKKTYNRSTISLSSSSGGSTRRNDIIYAGP